MKLYEDIENTPKLALVVYALQQISKQTLLLIKAFLSGSYITQSYFNIAVAFKENIVLTVNQVEQI